MNKLIKLLASNRGQAQPRAMESEGADTTVYLYEAIVADDASAEWFGGVSAQTLVPQIRAIVFGTLHMRINSPGGDVFAAQAIVSAIRDIRDRGIKVIAYIDGYAASAATVIATAADEIVMSNGAMYMIHCAWTFAYGNASDLTETANLLSKVDGVIASQYAARSGKTTDEIMTLMEAETWFTAQETVDAGLADRVAADAPEANARWDLSAYAKAPAPPPAGISNEHRERQQQRLQLMNRVNRHQ
jgi:ATP-dependent protease ClpP protease subunit